MPLRTPNPDPYDPCDPSRPFTAAELAAARFANACAAAATAFAAAAAAIAKAKKREVAGRLARKEQARQRFERARRWVRDHPGES